MAQDVTLNRPEVPAVALSQLETGMPARVLGLRLDARESDWLRALGITEGQWITVIRRALFGGPIHVRIESGGEFAIDRGLAGAIRCTRER